MKIQDKFEKLKALGWSDEDIEEILTEDSDEEEQKKKLLLAESNHEFWSNAIKEGKEVASKYIIKI